MELSPILLFVYNRLDHVQATVEALKKNILANESNLYIFSDGPKNDKDINSIKAIRQYIKTIEGFKNVKIFESEKNNGLANSIINGVTMIFQEYNSVVVLEDDLITSNEFLSFMNEAINYYNLDKEIWSISGYSLPISMPKNYKKDVYLGYRASSWGWATWKDRWELIDWNISDYEDFVNDKKKIRAFKRGGRDLPGLLEAQINGQVDSWAIRWCYNQFKYGKVTVFPCKSLINNIGFDGTGTHCEKSNQYKTNVSDYYSYKFEKEIIINKKIVRLCKDKYSGNLLTRIKRKINKFFQG